ncbi:hypothetical protein MTR_5g017010 [Medicago truncatula]|uniref:Uncharacterized protein n=1 Tax=Medicago truncatula TaxID=3880 RepID=G7K6L1_MEDTR|nr:hypothetical protein MTR_5g017010 [Medicago truncatula]
MKKVFFIFLEVDLWKWKGGGGFLVSLEEFDSVKGSGPTDECCSYFNPPVAVSPQAPAATAAPPASIAAPFPAPAPISLATAT